MRYFLPILSLTVLLTSCQTYQYISVESNTARRDGNYQFYYENDSLLLQYSFNGYNGPVLVTIHNKTDRPLYVDWKKSALIIQGNALSYYTSTQQLTGSTNSTQYRSGSTVSQSGTITGEIRGQEGIDFIPPRSMKEQSSLTVLSGFLDNLPDTEMKKQRPYGYQDMPALWTLNFNSSNSPFQWRSYLTLYFEEKKEFSVEHDFYVSAIRQGNSTPKAVPVLTDRKDVLYTSKMSQGGKAVGGALLAGVVLLTFAAAAGN
jgi:hypothetical protein